jgi:hypothetical protein
MRPYLEKNPSQKRDGRMAQGSNPSTPKQTNKQTNREFLLLFSHELFRIRSYLLRSKELLNPEISW